MGRDTPGSCTVNNTEDVAQKLYALLLQVSPNCVRPPKSEKADVRRSSQFLVTSTLQSHQVSVPLKLCPSTHQCLLSQPSLLSQSSEDSLEPLSRCNSQDDAASVSSQCSSQSSLTLAERRSLRKPLAVDVQITSLPQTPCPLFAASQQKTQPEVEQAQTCGWFSKCRGCAQLTAHEYCAGSSQVPFCSNCTHQLCALPASEQQIYEQQLLSIHQIWMKSGL